MILMKQLIVLLFFMCTCQLYAQGNHEFKEFRSKMMNDFHSFRNSVLNDYDKFLNGIWKDYEVFRVGKPDSVPKPIEVPHVETKPQVAPMDVECPLNAKIPVLDDIKETPVKIPTSIPVPSQIPIRESALDVNYYGLTIKLPQKMTSFEGQLLKHPQVSKYWKELERNNWKQVVPILMQYKQLYNYSDYMYYLLVEKYAKALETDVNKRCVIKLYLMVHSGYDARIALKNETLVLLLPFVNQLYACTYIEQYGVKFYLFSESEYPSGGTISSYEVPNNNEELKLLSARMIDNPRLAINDKAYNITDGVLSISGTVNENLMRVLSDLPQMSNILYAYPTLDGNCREQIIISLKKQLEGKSKVDALQALMHFMHFAFKYSTDQNQFGKEKPFFFEELLYYPKCDCEDRSVFFAYLIQHVLDLECHLLDFPGHIAVAVDIDGISGTYYIHEGKRYYIADPTYIGSSVGECMPDYLNISPNLLIIK